MSHGWQRVGGKSHGSPAVVDLLRAASRGTTTNADRSHGDGDTLNALRSGVAASRVSYERTHSAGSRVTLDRWNDNNHNTAPTVNAGADQTVLRASGATLSATVTDDGVTPVTLLWTQTSGPGTATFATPTAASTTVTFSVRGEYVLRLTADDGSGTNYDELTVVAVEPLTTIFSGELEFHYLYDSNVTVVGGLVSQWNDTSGRGNNVAHGTVANRPTANATGVGTNNRGYAGFTPTDHLFRFTQSSAANGKYVAMFMVCRRPEASPSGADVGSSNSHTGTSSRTAGLNQLVDGNARYSVNNDGVSSRQALSTGVAHTTSWRYYSGIHNALRMNGAEIATTTGAGAFDQNLTNIIRMRGFGTADGYEDIAFWACVASSSPLTSASQQVLDAEAYIRWYYGL